MDNNTPTSTIQDDLSQRNKQLHTIRRSFSKFQMAQQTPTISQLTRLYPTKMIYLNAILKKKPARPTLSDA
jgi:histone acetyltransferase (RNA polymerase elongator complex component)